MYTTAYAALPIHACDEMSHKFFQAVATAMRLHRIIQIQTGYDCIAVRNTKSALHRRPLRDRCFPVDAGHRPKSSSGWPEPRSTSTCAPSGRPELPRLLRGSLPHTALACTQRSESCRACQFARDRHSDRQ